MSYNGYSNWATWEANNYLSDIYNTDEDRQKEFLDDIINKAEGMIDKNTRKERLEDIVAQCVAEKVPELASEMKNEYDTIFEMQLENMTKEEAFNYGKKFANEMINFRELAVLHIEDSSLCLAYPMCKGDTLQVCLAVDVDSAKEKIEEKYGVSPEDIVVKELKFDDCLTRHIFNNIVDALPEEYRDRVREGARESADPEATRRDFVSEVASRRMDGGKSTLTCEEKGYLLQRCEDLGFKYCVHNACTIIDERYSHAETTVNAPSA